MQQSLSLSLGQSVISTSPAGGPPSSSVGSLGANPLLGIGAVRVASTVVTNVMRPVISTPLPIASKPREGDTSSSPHPPERKSLTPHQQPQLLIGSGSGGGAAATGGGYYSSSSPNPVGVGPGGVVTNLVLGGALSAQPAVQLITPSHQTQPSQHQVLPSAAVSVPHSQTNGPLPLPLLQPQFLPASSLAAPGGKAITQVQYILPTLPANTHPKSPPQQLSQPTSIFNLPTATPTHVSLANGKQQGTGSLTGYTSSSAVGVVSPGTRGENSSHDKALGTFSYYSVVTPNKIPILHLFLSLLQCKHSLQCCRVKCLFPWQLYGLRQPLPSSFPLWLHLFLSRTELRPEARSVRDTDMNTLYIVPILLVTLSLKTNH